MTEVQFTDRYDAAGISPCAWTICTGHCEGMSVYPILMEEWENLPVRDRPHICPQRNEQDEWDFPPEDGYLFVWCEECSGTGRRVNGRLGRWLDYIHTLYYPPRMFVLALQQRSFFAGMDHPLGEWGYAIPHASRTFFMLWREGKTSKSVKEM